MAAGQLKHLPSLSLFGCCCWDRLLSSPLARARWGFIFFASVEESNMFWIWKNTQRTIYPFFVVAGWSIHRVLRSEAGSIMPLWFLPSIIARWKQQSRSPVNVITDSGVLMNVLPMGDDPLRRVESRITISSYVYLILRRAGDLTISFDFILFYFLNTSGGSWQWNMCLVVVVLKLICRHVSFVRRAITVKNWKVSH